MNIRGTHVPGIFTLRQGCGIKGFYPTSVIQENLPRYVGG